MTQPTIPRQAGREAFGADPAGYDACRPDYPGWVYDLLRERCGLRPGTAAFEIGAGTGIATRPLLALGADPLVAVEPDARLAAFLEAGVPDPRLRIVVSTFEDADLPPSGFDLGISATAFHWLDEDSALAKIAALLRPGGWWAAVWNVFGDPDREDAFHLATLDLLAGPASPSAGEAGLPFGLDRAARLAAIERTGAFDCLEARIEPWTLELDTERTVALYATYSNVTMRPDADAVLAGIGRIARDQFGGRVTRNMMTSLYLARRTG